MRIKREELEEIGIALSTGLSCAVRPIATSFRFEEVLMLTKALELVNDKLASVDPGDHVPVQDYPFPAFTIKGTK